MRHQSKICPNCRKLAFKCDCGVSQPRSEAPPPKGMTPARMMQAMLAQQRNAQVYPQNPQAFRPAAHSNLIQAW